MTGEPRTKESGAFLPLDVPEAQAIIRRLCILQRDVAEVLDPRSYRAADCFCGESGFWPLNTPSHYRNELEAIDFIEQATRDALERPE